MRWIWSRCLDLWEIGKNLTLGLYYTFLTKCIINQQAINNILTLSITFSCITFIECYNYNNFNNFLKNNEKYEFILNFVINHTQHYYILDFPTNSAARHWELFEDCWDFNKLNLDKAIKKINYIKYFNGIKWDHDFKWPISIYELSKINDLGKTSYSLHEIKENFKIEKEYWENSQTQKEIEEFNFNWPGHWEKKLKKRIKKSCLHQNYNLNGIIDANNQKKIIIKETIIISVLFMGLIIEKIVNFK